MSSAFQKTPRISLSYKFISSPITKTRTWSIEYNAGATFAACIFVICKSWRSGFSSPKCDSENSSNLPSYQCSEKIQGRTASGIGGQRRISPPVALWETWSHALQAHHQDSGPSLYWKEKQISDSRAQWSRVTYQSERRKHETSIKFETK